MRELAAGAFPTAALGSRRLPGDFEARLFRMADIYIDHALAHPRLFELMFLAPRKGARRFPRDFKAGRSPTANATVAVIEEGMASGVLRAPTGRATTLYVVLGDWFAWLTLAALAAALAQLIRLRSRVTP